MLVSEKRDLAATRRFFSRALRNGTHPTEVTTDRACTVPKLDAGSVTLGITVEFGNRRAGHEPKDLGDTPAHSADRTR